MTSTDSTPALRDHVADSCRVLGHNGHGDYTSGHVAVRDPEGRGVWMKASNRGLEEIEPTDVLLVDWDGNVLDGDGNRHAEWPIHTEIMRARADVNVTVHSHPPYSIALGVSGKPLRPVSHAATVFPPPDVPRFNRTTDLILDREMGGHLADEIGSRPAMLMLNHGIVTVGETHQQAVMRAVLLEQACYHQLLAEMMGGVLHFTPDHELAAKGSRMGHPKIFEEQFRYLLRRISSRS